MGTQANYTIVGIFVISLFTAMIIAVIWLSAGLSLEEFSKYQINMRESVSGLNVDSPVEYNGVNVGSVQTIDLNKKDPQLVEILIKIKDEVPITKGTIATLATRGLTGLVYIALKDNSSNLTLLKPDGEHRYPIIPTAPSIFLRIDTAFTQLNQSLQDLTLSVRSVLDKENQQSIRDTLANLKQMSQEMVPLVKTSQHTVQWMESQMLPAAYQLFSNMDTMSKQLTQFTVQLQHNPAMLIRGQAKAPLGPGEVSLQPQGAQR